MTLSKLILTASVAVMALPFAGHSKINANWAASPKLHDVPDSVKTQSAVIILDERRMRVFRDNGHVIQERTMHDIIKLQDDKGLEGFKTFTVPAPDGVEILDLHGRVIQPDGTVRVVPGSSIKELTNESGVKEFMFAFEGLAKGAEVEYTYTDRRPLSYFGIEHFQYGLPTLEAIFVLTSPTSFKWESRGYNGFPILKDSISGVERVYYASATNIPYILEETYSNDELMRQRLEYKLSYVADEGDNKRLFTWSDLAKNIQGNLALFTDKEITVAWRYIKTIGYSEKQPALQKVRAIEDYLKTNIVVNGSLDPRQYGNFEKIVKDKICDERNFTRFMCACLSAAEIEYQIGIAPNRFRYVLEEGFENWKIMEEYLIYLPNENVYFHPTAFNFRVPFFPPSFAGTKSVFAKTTSSRTLKYVVPAIRDIPAPAKDASNHDLYAEVHFNEDMTPLLKYRQELKGYSSVGVREYFIYGEKDKEREMVSDIIGLIEQLEELKSCTVVNKQLNSQWDNKPLEIKAEIEAPHLVEKAGKKYIFKVGDIIGRQAELYSNEKRKLPIAIPFPHVLHRELIVYIPEGYKLMNPEDIRMTADAGGLASVIGFSSDYVLKGNELKITIHEHYDQMDYPLAEYEPYRRVINAAADFNKVVLMMEKMEED
jgi:hypothetical protein